MDKLYKPFKLNNEIILFAAEFSSNYRRFTPGNYYSSDKKLKINLNTNYEFGAASNNVWRIEHFTNCIQVSIDYINDLEIKQDFVFFMVIWSACLIHYKIETAKTDFERADKETLTYYKTTHRSIKNVVMGYVFIFKKWSSSDANNKRLKWILNSDNDLKEEKFPDSYKINHLDKTVTLYPMHLKRSSYYAFLDLKLKPEDVKCTDFFGKIITVLRKKYQPKNFKILFFYKENHPISL
jgi:hypothetical protein